MKKSFLLAAGWVLLAQVSSAGLYYEAVNTAEGGAESAAEWRVNAWVDGEKAKIEFVSSGNPLMPNGSYLLTTDGGQTMFLVRPDEGTYSKWDLEAMLRGLSSVMASTGGLISMTLENLRVELLVEEPGGTVAGRSTTHYQYRTSYRTVVKIMGMKRGESVTMDQEIWSTDSVSEQALGFWLRKTPPSFGDSGFDELVKAEMEKVKGFPLKVVTESVSTGRKGRQSRSRTVMEVVELREESIASGVFVLDPELVEQPMPVFAIPGEDEDGGGLRGLLKGLRGDG